MSVGIAKLSCVIFTALKSNIELLQKTFQIEDFRSTRTLNKVRKMQFLETQNKNIAQKMELKTMIKKMYNFMSFQCFNQKI